MQRQVRVSIRRGSFLAAATRRAVVVELERAQRATYRDACTAYVVIVVREHVISDADLSWRFSRSSGPGGQNVNTTDTRVQLTFDLAGSDAFPDELKTRMRTRLGDQVVVVAAEHRSQWRNRRAAEDRLAELLEEAMKPPPPPRVPTKPSKGSQQRRLHQKKKRGQTKRLRGRPED